MDWQLTVHNTLIVKLFEHDFLLIISFNELFTYEKG